MKRDILKKPVLHIFLILFLGIIAYSNTFESAFQFDDKPLIVNNAGLKDLSGFWPPAGSRWFGFFTFALNYHAGGLNPSGYHIVNLVIHLLNAVLVYWLVLLTFRALRLKTQRPVPDSSNYSFRLAALYCALLFVSHPVQTQAVTYIVQRFASLAACLYLLSIVLYVSARLRHEERIAFDGSARFFTAPVFAIYLLSLISAVFAMKTKEIAFTLPVVIILYEFIFFHGPVVSEGRKSGTPVWRRYIFVLPILATMAVIPLSVINTDRPLGEIIGEFSELPHETEAIPRLSYLFTQFRVIMTYLRLIFFPVNQILDYDYSIYTSFLDHNVLLSFTVLAGIAVFAVMLLHIFRKSARNSEYTAIHGSVAHYWPPIAGFGILWFFIALSVESSVIPITDVIFEHRVYLPSVGIFIAVSALIFFVADKLQKRWRWSNTAVAGAAACIIILLTAATYARNTVWKDEVSLWEDVLEKSPENVRGYYNLGVAYASKGLVFRAIKNYRVAISKKPDYKEAHKNLGFRYLMLGDTDRAIEQLEIAERLAPDDPMTHLNLGIAYKAKGMMSESQRHYRIARQLNPLMFKRGHIHH